MRKKYEGRKFIKRIVSQLLVIALLITSCNLNNLGVVFAENEEEKTYMLLENYTQLLQSVLHTFKPRVWFCSPLLKN